MRYVGILIMAAAVGGVGFFAADCTKERLDILLLLRQMVYHLKNQILYANATLPEALLEVGTRFSNGRTGIWREPGQFFCRIYSRLEENGELPFSDVWKMEAEQISREVSLNRTDRQNLASLGENLGYADREMQERTLLFYLEQLDEAITGARQEVEVRSKLYRSLGLASGLFIIIMLM